MNKITKDKWNQLKQELEDWYEYSRLEVEGKPVIKEVLRTMSRIEEEDHHE